MVKNKEGRLVRPAWGVIHGGLGAFTMYFVYDAPTWAAFGVFWIVSQVYTVSGLNAENK
jgi:hypothetical protein